MKYLLLILACLLIVGTSGTTRADAQGIEVLSQQYHVQGEIWGYTETYDPESYSYHYEPFDDSYDEVSIAPISKNMSLEHSYSSSSASQFSISQWTDSMTMHGTENAAALVDATWTFKPLTSNLEVTFNYDVSELNSQWNYSQIWLMDITENSELGYTDSQYWDMQYGWPWPPDSYGGYRNGWETYKLSVDLTHEYSLRMRSYSESEGYNTGYSSDVSATFVPEPASAILIGAGFFFARLRRRQR